MNKKILLVCLFLSYGCLAITQSCDTILLRDGYKFTVSDIKLKGAEVFYEHCPPDSSGATQTRMMRSQSIQEIRYASGSNRQFKLEKTGPKVVMPNPYPNDKTFLIPKLELYGFVQKRIGLELEFPISRKSSLVLHASRRALNRSHPMREPGSYTKDYIETTDESYDIITIIFPVAINKQTNTYFAPAPFEDLGDFLPATAYILSPKFRAYLGKRDWGSRFYVEPGALVYWMKGSGITYNSVLVDQNITTTNTQNHGTRKTVSSYHQTVTVTDGKTVIAGGASLGLGYQACFGRRLVLDLGLELQLQTTREFHGLKQPALAPSIQVGYKI